MRSPNRAAQPHAAETTCNRLLIVSLLALLSALACGRSEPRDLEPSPRVLRPIDQPGRWREYTTHRFDENLDEEQRKRIAELEAIGYLSGSRDAQGQGGVLIHEPERTRAGLNFYTSGHDTEAILMSMDGRVLHRWHYAFWDAWPDFPVVRDHAMTGFWRRTYLYPNGDILAIHEGLGILRLDKDSRLVWARPNRAHHDLDIQPNGDIYLLTREARLVPRIHPDEPILEDFLVILSDAGREKRRVSLLEAFERSAFQGIARSVVGRSGDIFHTNTVRVLAGRAAGLDPAFERGNVLIYMLAIGVVAVLDIESETVVWARREKVLYQHDPSILPNGNLIVFVNLSQGRLAGDVSKVVEYRGLSDEVSWQYGATPQQFFQSPTCGSVTRLEGGNTLIVESDGGRAFEVTPEGNVVWAFANPNRAGPEGRFVATLFDLERLPLDYARSWLEDRPAADTADR